MQLRFQGGMDVGVPIFLDVDRAIVKPGASLSGWGGFDIGWVVFELGIGLHWTLINTDNVPELRRPLGIQPLIRLHASPGVRFQVPLWDDIVLPYISGVFDANWWQFEALGADCLTYYCRDDSRAQWAPGFSGKVGTAIHLKKSIYLDVGFEYSLSGPGNFFDRTEWWVQPYIGFIYRGDTDRLGGTGY